MENMHDVKVPEKSEYGSDGPSGAPESLAAVPPSPPGADHEKTLLGQAPLPVQPPLPTDDIAQLQKLDSKVVNVDGQQEDDPFKHLPDHEREILKRQVDEPEVKVGFFTLYRYTTRLDILILIVSSITTIAAGAAMPLMTVR
jgi:ATP-binding cassette, subfamily B (MDR/TAP), member 1